jgi:MerR family transcriptional regulator, light-induced transcriptional regulator
MHKTVLSTVDVARLFNVTETTVKRWADEGTLKCQKTPGGHRKFPVRNVIDFAEKNNFEPTGALTMPDHDGLGSAIQVAILGRDFPSLVRAFIEKALSADRSDLYTFFSFLYEHRIQLWEIFDLVLRPGMVEIGERWVRGEINISQEHHASYETLDALARLQAEILMKPRTSESVLFACLGDELHEIGLRCASYVFEAEGWTTHYIGARTPSPAIINALGELKPSVAALSITQLSEPGQLRQDIAGIAQAARSHNIRLILGGTGIPADVLDSKMYDGHLQSSRAIHSFIDLYTQDQRRTSAAQRTP